MNSNIDVDNRIENYLNINFKQDFSEVIDVEDEGYVIDSLIYSEFITDKVYNRIIEIISNLSYINKLRIFRDVFPSYTYEIWFTYQYIPKEENPADMIREKENREKKLKQRKERLLYFLNICRITNIPTILFLRADITVPVNHKNYKKIVDVYNDIMLPLVKKELSKPVILPLYIEKLFTEEKMACGYIKRGELGQGAFGIVYLVEDPKTREKYAMKQFKSELEKGINKYIIKEMNLLASLTHVNLVKPHELTISSKDNICCILNFMDSDLGKYIETNNLSTENIIKIFIQVVSGIDFLHQNKIIHTDLKPPNVLIKYEKTKVIAKISDLDCIISPENKVIADREITTLWYRAPEVNYEEMNRVLDMSLGNLPPIKYRYNGYFSNKIDIWALGLIFYELFKKGPLFVPNNESTLALHTISILYKTGFMEDKHKEEYFGKIPPKYIPLLLSMLELEPEKRPTARDILYSLGSYPIPGISSFSKPIKGIFTSSKNNVLAGRLAELSCKYGTRCFYGSPTGKKYMIAIMENIYRTTINIIYNYREIVDIEDTILQATGSVCFLLACKLFDIDMTLDNIIPNDSITIKELIIIECDILKKLKFKLYSNTKLEKENMEIFKNLIDKYIP